MVAKRTQHHPEVSSKASSNLDRKEVRARGLTPGEVQEFLATICKVFWKQAVGNQRGALLQPEVARPHA
jgi:hypothetical protein